MLDQTKRQELEHQLILRGYPNITPPLDLPPNLSISDIFLDLTGLTKFSQDPAVDQLVREIDQDTAKIKQETELEDYVNLEEF